MNLDDIANKITEESIVEYYEKIYQQMKIREIRMSRFHYQVQDISPIVEKIIEKYNSHSYRQRWFNRGYESQEYLYEWLFSCAEKYGEPTEISDDIYSIFVSAKYLYKGWYFERVDGQGTYFKVYKDE